WSSDVCSSDLYLFPVFVKGEIFFLYVLQQSKFLGAVVEFLIADHTILHEDADVIPLLLKFRAFLAEHILKLVGHFLRDMLADLLDIGVALQVTARVVQRNVRRVQHAVQQHQKIRYNIFNLIGDEDLATVELYFVLVKLEVVLNLREVQDTCQRERIVDVEVNPEQWVFRERIYLLIESEVVFILEVGRLTGPQGVGVVDDPVAFYRLVFRLAVLVFSITFAVFLCAELDFYGEELAVLFENALQTPLIEEFFGVFVDVEDDVGSAFSLLGRLQLKFGRSIAYPMSGFIFACRIGT